MTDCILPSGHNLNPQDGHTTTSSSSSHTSPFMDARGNELAYRTYQDEHTDLSGLTRLCEEELSEPYNVYTFRYFLVEWPHLTFFVYPSSEDVESIATIICKQDVHRERTNRGYIGMLSVDSRWRRRGIARKLAELAISEMQARGAHEVVLETEYDNAPSLALYEALGFVREKRLHRFYSNGKDAFRLILPLGTHPLIETAEEADRARWLLSQHDVAPAEIGFVFDGPSGAWPQPDTDDVTAVARLSLETSRPHPPRPDCIM